MEQLSGAKNDLPKDSQSAFDAPPAVQVNNRIKRKVNALYLSPVTNQAPIEVSQNPQQSPHDSDFVDYDEDIGDFENPNKGSIPRDEGTRSSISGDQHSPNIFDIEGDLDEDLYCWDNNQQSNSLNS